MNISFQRSGKDRSGEPRDRTPHSLDSDPMFVEQFKNLCSRFEYRIDALNYKVVAVTSAIAGEGKSVSCTNLARNLASAGRKKVLLVDVDLRKSDLAEVLKVRPVPGLTEYLAGSASMNEILRDSVAPGLCVIPAGLRISSPWELLKGDRFRAFLQEVRERYDLILVDTPPVIPVSDTLALRDLVDGFILVCRLGFTPHLLFKQAMEEIGEKKLLGVVLNGVKPQSERYYQRYYGRYYTKPGKQ